MTIVCASPNPDLGVALRLAEYVDCQARALGENGFQALAGGPVAASLLSGLVTIFVALIGYRLMLGRTPGLSDGVGWAVRLGLVLALVTSWPAFQTLVYRVAVDAPGELAGVFLPAAGLPSENLDVRIQQAYDTMRLGSTPEQPRAGDRAVQAPDFTQPGQPQAPGQPAGQPQKSSLGQPPLPQTASLFVISTSGVSAAFRIAIGFLLAIGPLAIMALLFDATLGLFSGWVRALVSAACGALAATIVTALDLVLIESELANLQAYSAGGIAQIIDPQALTTIVLLFAIVMLIATLSAARVGGAFRLTLSSMPGLPEIQRPATSSPPQSVPALQTVQDLDARQSGASQSSASRSGMPVQTRVGAVADALASTVRREQGSAGASATPEAPSRSMSIIEAAGRAESGTTAVPLGLAGRRSLGRRTRSAARRDRIA